MTWTSLGDSPQQPQPSGCPMPGTLSRPPCQDLQTQLHLPGKELSLPKGGDQHVAGTEKGWHTRHRNPYTRMCSDNSPTRSHGHVSHTHKYTFTDTGSWTSVRGQALRQSCGSSADPAISPRGHIKAEVGLEMWRMERSEGN